MRFLMEKGEKQLKYGDLRGFETEAEAAYAAKGTTYNCAYKAMDYKKAISNSERFRILQEKNVCRKNTTCIAYRADFPKFDAQTKSFIGFGKCFCMAEIDEEGNFKCYECFFEKKFSEIDSLLRRLEHLKLINRYEGGISNFCE